jgi:hypothetical protein
LRRTAMVFRERGKFREREKGERKWERREGEGKV